MDYSQSKLTTLRGVWVVDGLGKQKSERVHGETTRRTGWNDLFEGSTWSRLLMLGESRRAIYSV